MAPIPEIITSNITHISAHDIFEYILLLYKTTIVFHPYISGFFLIMWSYHPKAPFQAVTYLCWILPKNIFIWILRSRGFQFGEEVVQADDYDDRIPVDSPSIRYSSYGAINDGNNYHEVVDEVSIWWRLFGLALYLLGFAVMLVYGSLAEG